MIYGHDAVRRRLGQALAQNRIASAYMFLGKPGIGKRLLAAELAAGLNCEEMKMPPCSHCSACRKVLSGAHPDVTVIQPDGAFIKIDQIRDLNSRIRYRPFEGRTKVVIIPEAEKMNVPAQNAFLKTLEEPPRDTVIILTATNLTTILPTILSRCQVIKLKPLPRELIQRMVAEQGGYSEDEARLLASLADGSAGRALGLDRDLVVENRRKILSRLLNLNGHAEMLGFAQDVVRNYPDLDNILNLISAFYHDVLYKKLGHPRMINADLETQVANQARSLTIDGVIFKLAAVQEARANLSRNANKQLTLEVLTLTLKDVLKAD